MQCCNGTLEKVSKILQIGGLILLQYCTAWGGNMAQHHLGTTVRRSSSDPMFQLGSRSVGPFFCFATQGISMLVMKLTGAFGVKAWKPFLMRMIYDFRLHPCFLLPEPAVPVLARPGSRLALRDAPCDDGERQLRRGPGDESEG